MIIDNIKFWVAKMAYRTLAVDAILKAKPYILKSFWKFPIFKIPVRIPERHINKLRINDVYNPTVHYKNTLLSKYTRYRQWNIRATRRYTNYATKVFGNQAPNFHYGLGNVLSPESIKESIKMDEMEAICKKIRDSMVTGDQQEETHKPLDNAYHSLENFTLSDQPIVGCAGAVYHAFLKGEFAAGNKKKAETHRHPEKNSAECRTLARHDLSIKVLFNYAPDVTAPVDVLKGMFRELLPLPSQAIRADDYASSTWLSRRSHLPSHPNVVKILSAFVCPFPTWLPGAKEHFEAALPSQFGSPTTLCLVMKRYDCTLESYLKEQPFYSSRIALLLLTQLLEALVWLQRHQITHRDIKPNNILLDFSRGMADPQLVLADFGNAILGNTDPTGDLGGNPFYTAPELLQERQTKLDYSRSDIWSVGALAYLLYGGPCPVEALRQGKQPEPPATMPRPVAVLVKSMVKPRPSQRPNPTLAATVCQLVLRIPQPPPVDRIGLLTWLMALRLEKFPDLLRDTFLKRVHFPTLCSAAAFVRANWSD